MAQGRVRDLESVFHRSEAELAAALSDKRTLENDVAELRAQLAKVAAGGAGCGLPLHPHPCPVHTPGEFGDSGSPRTSRGSRQRHQLLVPRFQAEDGHAVAKKQLEKETLMRVDLENRCQSLQEELAFRKDVFEEVGCPPHPPAGARVFPHFLPLPALGTHLLIPASTITRLSSVCASASLIATLVLGFGATQIVQDGLEPCILITPAKTCVQEGYVGRLWGSAHGHAFWGSSFRLLQTLPGLLASGPRLPGLAGLTRALAPLASRLVLAHCAVTARWNPEAATVGLTAACRRVRCPCNCGAASCSCQAPLQPEPPWIP